MNRSLKTLKTVKIINAALFALAAGAAGVGCGDSDERPLVQRIGQCGIEVSADELARVRLDDEARALLHRASCEQLQAALGSAKGDLAGALGRLAALLGEIIDKGMDAVESIGADCNDEGFRSKHPDNRGAACTADAACGCFHDAYFEAHYRLVCLPVGVGQAAGWATRRVVVGSECAEDVPNGYPCGSSSHCQLPAAGRTVVVGGQERIVRGRICKKPAYNDRYFYPVFSRESYEEWKDVKICHYIL